jgi:hypothetical protein
MLPSLELQLWWLRLIGRFGFRFGEKINLLGDDFAAVTSKVFIVCPLGVMDTSSHHDHGTFGDMIGNAFSDTVEAGNPMPLGFLLALAFADLVGPRCRQRDVCNVCIGFGFTNIWIVAYEADECD